MQPIESPEVIFIGHIPVHEHIYSNGFICLSILYDGTPSPTQNGRPP
jgi:ubiquitin-conjugating enzyme E2 W